MGIPCLSCKQPVAEGNQHFFHDAFVCGDCHHIATRMLQAGAAELEKALGMLKESIRFALLRGTLQFKTREQLDNMNSPELLRELAELMQKAMESSECAPTPSSPSTPPHVRTLAAVGLSSSKKHNLLGSPSAVPSSPAPIPSRGSAESVSGTERSK